MLPWSDWVVPSARKTGDEGEAHLHRPFDNPHDAENTARMGDEGKAVGRVPPTALLFVQAINTRSLRSNSWPP